MAPTALVEVLYAMNVIKSADGFLRNCASPPSGRGGKDREGEGGGDRTNSVSAPSSNLVESLKSTPTLESHSWYPRPYLSL